MSNVAEKNVPPEAVVAALVQEIVEVINAAPRVQREGLREDAVARLRDEVEMNALPVQAEMQVAASFNSFGIAIPLLLMGAVLVFLFPPVGLLMFAIAGVLVAWGVGTTLLTRR